MKAILVVDVEECGDYYVDVYRKDTDDSFEGRYYLKPMPEKKEENLPDTSIPWTRAELMAYTHGIAGGYNECLEKILGETE